MADEQKKGATKATKNMGEAREITVDELKAGMTIRVHEKIRDVSAKGEERERVQIYEGLVLGLRGTGLSRTMTVRKNADGWAVEKIYPVKSPVVSKVELVKTAKVRRARLSFITNKKMPFKRKLKEQAA
jgi:large subunit ribosomal protein L19